MTDWFIHILPGPASAPSFLVLLQYEHVMLLYRCSLMSSSNWGCPSGEKYIPLSSLSCRMTYWWMSSKRAEFKSAWHDTYDTASMAWEAPVKSVFLVRGKAFPRVHRYRTKSNAEEIAYREKLYNAYLNTATISLRYCENAITYIINASCAQIALRRETHTHHVGQSQRGYYSMREWEKATNHDALCLLLITARAWRVSYE